MRDGNIRKFLVYGLSSSYSEAELKLFFFIMEMPGCGKERSASYLVCESSNGRRRVIYHLEKLRHVSQLLTSQERYDDVNEGVRVRW